MTVSDSVQIAADPLAVYEQVSDPRQMRRWSPENLSASVPDAGPAYVGMKFVGHNKRGPMRWVTRCTVIAAEPGRRFAFDVDQYGFGVPLLPVKIARWEYTFEPVTDGTLVTETWTDGRTRWPDSVTARFDPIATGGKSFADFQRRNIAKTLKNLKADFESTTG